MGCLVDSVASITNLFQSSLSRQPRMTENHDFPTNILKPKTFTSTRVKPSPYPKPHYRDVEPGVFSPKCPGVAGPIRSILQAADTNHHEQVRAISAGWNLLYKRRDEGVPGPARPHRERSESRAQSHTRHDRDRVPAPLWSAGERRAEDGAAMDQASPGRLYSTVTLCDACHHCERRGSRQGS